MISENFIHELENAIKGEVHTDNISRSIYSVDASIYEIPPLVIALPKDSDDLIKIMKLAFIHKIPITLRGAATGITGGCLGKGIVIDTSKYLNNILEINIEAKYAICEPGVVQDRLNEALSKYGYRLGPDTSTGNRATIGGMAANNAAGSRSLKFGTMSDHVLEAECILPSGDLILFKKITQEEFAQKATLPTSEGQICRTILHILKDNEDEIKKHFPDIPRISSGYNLRSLLNEPINIAQLIVGSEGTLAAIKSLKVAIVPKLKETFLCLIYFDDLLQSFQNIEDILSYKPIAVELIDHQIIQQGRLLPHLKNKLDWLPENPQAFLAVEFEEKEKLTAFQKAMKVKMIGYLQKIMTDPTQIASVWELRKSGLGVLLSKRSYSRAIAFIEDLSIPPNKLFGFMEEFLALLKIYHKQAGIYGHAGSGCLHIRPYIDLRDPAEVKIIPEIMQKVADLILKQGGALTGEHGDGIIRSWLHPKMFGQKINQAFIDLKKAFDPLLLMNPGKIVFPIDPLKDLRLSPDTKTLIPQTFLNFEKEGGFDLAVDLCNGNGQCRKKEGIMCPSFQVDNDEFHSTRARAQSFRDMIHGHIAFDDFANSEIHEVLDLCIMCKGCKTECPSQVDMAKMKAEFLYHYHQKYGTKLRDYLFGYVGPINRLFSLAPRFFNFINGLNLTKRILAAIGISAKRTLPQISQKRFSKSVNNHFQSDKKVVLFNDTFTEFNHPDIGLSAVKVLNALGYEVIIPPWKCCGRPLISKGLLPQARKYAENVIALLKVYDHPIIGLEPSCLFAIKDDYKDLVKEQDIIQLASRCITFDEFLAKHIQDGKLPLSFSEVKQKTLFHGHCHQKALEGTKYSLQLLKSIPGMQVEEIPSGCCGMAGSFGYEKEHFDFSMKIGALKLFPAIKPDAIVVANGTSCRHQIQDGTSTHAFHIAEIVANLLKD